MNPSEISDALSGLASQPYDLAEFPLRLRPRDGQHPRDNRQNSGVAALTSRTSPGGRSDGGNQNVPFQGPPRGGFARVWSPPRMTSSDPTSGPRSTSPRSLIATDGVRRRRGASEIRRHAALRVLPSSGTGSGSSCRPRARSGYRAAEENPVDVKVAGKLAKLYDALIRTNSDWAAEERRHDMNQLMTRLIFCMFAEDVGIFPGEDQFSRLLFTHSGDRGGGYAGGVDPRLHRDEHAQGPARRAARLDPRVRLRETGGFSRARSTRPSSTGPPQVTCRDGLRRGLEGESTRTSSGR